jgi:hypothetical protein
MSKSKSIIRQLDIIRNYNPEMNIGKGGVGETVEVYFSGIHQLFTLWLFYSPCELYASYPADTPCLQGDGTRNCGIGKKFSAVPGRRIGGDDKCVILLVPGIEA